MKRGLKVFLVLVALCAAVTLCWWGYRQVFVAGTDWYACVDAGRLSEAGENGNGFDYHYELPAARADGRVGTLGFDTSRELRDGAYLRLTTLALRGVVSWEEVAWGDIPTSARAALAVPDASSGGAS